MRLSPLSEKVGTIVSASERESLQDLDLEPIQEALKRTGAVFFQGFGAELDDFESFGNRFSDDYMDNTGSGSYRQTAEGRDGTIQNVAYTFGVKTQRTFGLPPHADRSY